MGKFSWKKLTAWVAQTILNCIDNSGAALVECALVIGKKKAARIGTSYATRFPAYACDTARPLTPPPWTI